MSAAGALLHDVHFSGNAYDAAAGAYALVIITEWDAFRALDFVKLAATMQAKILVDLRNVYRSEDVTSQGFTYFSIGRPASSIEQKLATQ
jgi:UDPglucose 6-dehydrogenase